MDERISNFSQVASLRRYVLSEGKERGVEVIDCDNGKLRFLLNVTKSLDIMQIYYEGENVSFVSKNGFSTLDKTFVKRFEGGALYTCGLDGVGSVENVELHGTFHNIPARVSLCSCNEDGIRVEAIIEDSELFGKHLVVKRKITSKVCSNSVQVEDELINLGNRDEQYCLLYHVNLGYPFLDEGVTVNGKICNVEPRTKWAEINQKDYNVMGKAVPNAEETCYFLSLDEPYIEVENAKLKKKVRLDFSSSFTQFVLWKSTCSNDYAMGIEPSTTKLDSHFKYLGIKRGESKKFSMKFSVIR